MKSVTVNHTLLVKIVHRNRKKHHSEVTQAKKAWREETIAIMKRNLDRLERNSCEPQEPIEPQPEDYTKQYDLALRMLDMEVHAEVELDVESYRRLVEDEWFWKDRFISMTGKYIKR